MAAPPVSYENFLKRALLAHGTKYSYPNLNYRCASEKIEIVCPAHGAFHQSASNHLRGQGCKNCRIANNTLSFNGFLQKARQTHGDQYEYLESTYSKSTATVAIVCKTHGTFSQKAYKHYGGQGCPVCAPSKIAKNQTMTFDEFRKRANLLFGDLYIYHEGSFTRGNSLTRITCKIHGDFEQNASGHLIGNGCPKCSSIRGAAKSALKNIIPFEEFVRRSKVVFGDKYNYLEDKYFGISKKTTINCKAHGDFKILAVEHTRGNGCPNCSFARSRPERMIRKFLTENNVKSVEQWTPDGFYAEIGKRLRYDFYLPDFETIIEYDGRHHFQPAFGSTPEKALAVFKRTQQNDKLKNEWAAKHGYVLHRISDERTLEKDLIKIIYATLAL